MTSISDLQKGDVSAIVITLIAGGLGFYLAIAVSDAVRATVDRFLPDTEDEVARNWIALFVAIIVVGVAIYLIVNYLKTQLK